MGGGGGGCMLVSRGGVCVGGGGMSRPVVINPTSPTHFFTSPTCMLTPVL